MPELHIKILDLINKKYTINEILNELCISRQTLLQAFREMRTIGINFSKQFYSCGEIVYSVRQQLDVYSKIPHVNIITEPDFNFFRALCISDLHLGSKFENVGALDKVFDYCKKNDIHTIIILGDFLDGINIGNKNYKLHNNPLEQMVYATEAYPYDSDITSFLLLGNHDIDSLVSYGIDFAEYLANNRYDVIPIGYGRGIINVKNDKILLSHPIGVGNIAEHYLKPPYLFLKGHTHMMKSIITDNGSCSLHIPSMGNLLTIGDDDALPGAIDISITFRGGFIDSVSYQHLLFDNNPIFIGSAKFKVSHPGDRNFHTPVKYEHTLTRHKI